MTPDWSWRVESRRLVQAVQTNNHTVISDIVRACRELRLSVGDSLALRENHRRADALQDSVGCGLRVLMAPYADYIMSRLEELAATDHKLAVAVEPRQFIAALFEHLYQLVRDICARVSLSGSFDLIDKEVRSHIETSRTLFGLESSNDDMDPVLHLRSTFLNSLGILRKMAYAVPQTLTRYFSDVSVDHVATEFRRNKVVPAMMRASFRMRAIHALMNGCDVTCFDADPAVVLQRSPHRHMIAHYANLFKTDAVAGITQTVDHFKIHHINDGWFADDAFALYGSQARMWFAADLLSRPDPINGRPVGEVKGVRKLPCPAIAQGTYSRLTNVVTSACVKSSAWEAVLQTMRSQHTLVMRPLPLSKRPSLIFRG